MPLRRVVKSKPCQNINYILIQIITIFVIARFVIPVCFYLFWGYHHLSELDYKYLSIRNTFPLGIYPKDNDHRYFDIVMPPL